jgi:hypothetical protein
MTRGCIYDFGTQKFKKQSVWRRKGTMGNAVPTVLKKMGLVLGKYRSFLVREMEEADKLGST